MKRVLGFKIKEVWGLPLPSWLCDIGRVPNLARLWFFHLSNGDNYYPNLSALSDWGEASQVPRAQCLSWHWISGTDPVLARTQRQALP